MCSGWGNSVWVLFFFPEKNEVQKEMFAILCAWVAGRLQGWWAGAGCSFPGPAVLSGTQGVDPTQPGRLQVGPSWASLPSQSHFHCFLTEPLKVIIWVKGEKFHKKCLGAHVSIELSGGAPGVLLDSYLMLSLPWTAVESILLLGYEQVFGGLLAPYMF